MITTSPGRISMLAETSPRRTRSLSRTRYCRPPSAVRSTDALLPSAKSVRPADRDHHVEQRHPLPVRQGLRARRLPDHSDLLAVGAVELRDEDRHHGIADESAHRFLDVARELRRGLADGGQVFDQRYADLSIRPHRYGGRQIRVAPDGDLQGVERADQVVVVGRGAPSPGAGGCEPQPASRSGRKCGRKPRPMS